MVCGVQTPRPREALSIRYADRMRAGGGDPVHVETGLRKREHRRRSTLGGDRGALGLEFLASRGDRAVGVVEELNCTRCHTATASRRIAGSCPSERDRQALSDTKTRLTTTFSSRDRSAHAALVSSSSSP